MRIKLDIYLINCFSCINKKMCIKKLKSPYYDSMRVQQRQSKATFKTTLSQVTKRAKAREARMLFVENNELPFVVVVASLFYPHKH